MFLVVAKDGFMCGFKCGSSGVADEMYAALFGVKEVNIELYDDLNEYLRKNGHGVAEDKLTGQALRKLKVCHQRNTQS